MSTRLKTKEVRRVKKFFKSLIEMQEICCEIEEKLVASGVIGAWLEKPGNWRIRGRLGTHRAGVKEVLKRVFIGKVGIFFGRMKIVLDED
ncbi:hypothetical protein Tco_1286981 [Tanacetum coccineum]